MNVSSVARDGLRRMAATDDYESGRSQGRQALESLAGDPIADCMLVATGRELANESAYRAQEVALQALAEGTPSLAAVGFVSLDRAVDWEDGRHMGPAFLEGIAKGGPPDEKAVAEAA